MYAFKAELGYKWTDERTWPCFLVLHSALGSYAAGGLLLRIGGQGYFLIHPSPRA